MKKFFLKKKKAWVNMLEAFMSITFLMVVILVVLEQNNNLKEDSSEEIYTLETGILRNIQFNETCRAYILNAVTPVYWSDNLFPFVVKEEIQKKIPLYLNCTAKICNIHQPCPFEEEIGKSIYSQSSFISANATTYSPKILRIFCWEK